MYGISFEVKLCYFSFDDNLMLTRVCFIKRHIIVIMKSSNFGPHKVKGEYRLSIHYRPREFSIKPCWLQTRCLFVIASVVMVSVYGGGCYTCVMVTWSLLWCC